MSITSRLRQSSPKPPAHKRAPAFKHPPFDLTAFQQEANRLATLTPKQRSHAEGSRGKVPGKPRAIRKYPDGKKVALQSQPT